MRLKDFQVIVRDNLIEGRLETLNDRPDTVIAEELYPLK